MFSSLKKYFVTVLQFAEKRSKFWIPLLAPNFIVATFIEDALTTYRLLDLRITTFEGIWQSPRSQACLFVALYTMLQLAGILMIVLRANIVIGTLFLILFMFVRYFVRIFTFNFLEDIAFMGNLIMLLASQTGSRQSHNGPRQSQIRNVLLLLARICLCIVHINWAMGENMSIRAILAYSCLLSTFSGVFCKFFAWITCLDLIYFNIKNNAWWTSDEFWTMTIFSDFCYMLSYTGGFMLLALLGPGKWFNVYEVAKQKSWKSALNSLCQKQQLQQNQEKQKQSQLLA